jgi:hypothetical protein
MAEHGDVPLIDDLMAALDAYEEVRKGWREVAPYCLNRNVQRVS